MTLEQITNAILGQPTVQDVHIGFGKFAWTWNYRLGNKIVCGPGYRTERLARKGFADHLAERGLTLPGLGKP